MHPIGSEEAGLASRPRLPVIETDGDETLFVDAAGRPRWPVTSPAQLRVLQAVAGVMGGVVDAGCAATAGEQPAFERQASAAPAGCVVALGRDARSAAQLYAHLTARPLGSPAEQPAELADRGSCDVVVTTGRFVDNVLFDALYGDESGHEDGVAGIVWGNSPTELRDCVLLRSAARALAAAGPVSRVDVRPLSDASPRLSELGAGAGLLNVVTHSDGIDAYLGADLTLCPLLAASGKLERSPRCVETGWCHRAQLTVAQARDEGRLLDPAVFAARLLLWDVCFGILPRNGPLARVLDRDWGLMRQLLANPRIGAIVTTTGIDFGTADRQPLLSALASGEPLGAALGAQRAADARRGQSSRLVLFGDPALEVTIEHRSPLAVRREVRSPRRTPAATATAPDRLGFLATTVRMQIARAPGMSTTGNAALRALRDWRADDSAAPAGRTAMLEHLLAHNRMFTLDWRPLARMGGSLPAHACLGCSCPTWPHALVAHGRVVRRVTACPRCGIVEDSPIKLRLGLAVEGRRFTLAGQLPPAPVVAGLLLGSLEPSDMRAFRWPLDAIGKPARSFEPPMPWPAGPLRAIAMLIIDADLVLLQQPARAG